MDLVNEARKGREEAFLQLFDKHHLPLFRFAYRLTGSVADAEDIVQESFLRLLRADCLYDPRRTSVRPYLFGAVRNQALKQQRHKEKSDEDAGDPVDCRSPEKRLMFRARHTDTAAGSVGFGGESRQTHCFRAKD
jgi:RNA polymerase sigma-70 factor (ECF subfamily)